MIQYLTLDMVEPFSYRSREGMGIKLRFVGGERPVFAYEHQSTVDSLGAWNERIGETMPVSTRLERSPDHERDYLVARIMSSLTRDPRRDP